MKREPRYAVEVLVEFGDGSMRWVSEGNYTMPEALARVVEHVGMGRGAHVGPIRSAPKVKRKAKQQLELIIPPTGGAS